VLVRARAYRTARTLFNTGKQTALGNIPRQHSTSVLCTLHLLVEEHGFVPDRVTTNIVVKAALRSPIVLDVTLVRQLFDYFA
jgi:hypothetical protein